MLTYHHLVIGNGKLHLKYNKWLYISVVSNSLEVWRKSLPTLVSKSRMWHFLLRQEVKCYLLAHRKGIKIICQVFKRFRLLLVAWWPGVTMSQSQLDPNLSKRISWRRGLQVCFWELFSHWTLVVWCGMPGTSSHSCSKRGNVCKLKVHW